MLEHIESSTDFKKYFLNLLIDIDTIYFEDKDITDLDSYNDIRNVTFINEKIRLVDKLIKIYESLPIYIDVTEYKIFRDFEFKCDQLISIYTRKIILPYFIKNYLGLNISIKFKLLDSLIDKLSSIQKTYRNQIDQIFLHGRIN